MVIFVCEGDSLLFSYFFCIEQSSIYLRFIYAQMLWVEMYPFKINMLTSYFPSTSKCDLI